MKTVKGIGPIRQLQPSKVSVLYLKFPAAQLFTLLRYNCSGCTILRLSILKKNRSTPFNAQFFAQNYLYYVLRPRETNSTSPASSILQSRGVGAIRVLNRSINQNIIAPYISQQIRGACNNVNLMLMWCREWNVQLQKCETSMEAYTSYTTTALRLADVR